MGCDVWHTGGGQYQEPQHHDRPEEPAASGRVRAGSCRRGRRLRVSAGRHRDRDGGGEGSSGVGLTAFPSIENTVCIAYSGLVPMSPKTTPTAPIARPMKPPRCVRDRSVSGSAACRGNRLGFAPSARAGRSASGLPGISPSPPPVVMVRVCPNAPNQQTSHHDLESQCDPTSAMAVRAASRTASQRRTSWDPTWMSSRGDQVAALDRDRPVHPSRMQLGRRHGLWFCAIAIAMGLFVVLCLLVVLGFAGVAARAGLLGSGGWRAGGLGGAGESFRCFSVRRASRN